MNNRVISIKRFKRIQAQIDLCASQNEDCDLCPPYRRAACRASWDAMTEKVPAKVGTYEFKEPDTIKPSPGNPLVECVGVSLPHGSKMRPITMADVHGCPTGAKSPMTLR